MPSALKINKNEFKNVVKKIVLPRTTGKREERERKEQKQVVGDIMPASPKPVESCWIYLFVY